LSIVLIMKKYVSKNTKKGKLAYRTPSRFIYQQYKEVMRRKKQSDKKY